MSSEHGGQSRFLLSTRQRELLNAMLAKEGIAPSPARTASASDRGGAELPLSFAQERLWFLERFQPGMPTYSIMGNSRVTGRVHLPALHESLNEIVRRHDALRATFRPGLERPVQVIAPVLRLPLPAVDLRHMPVEHREAEVQRMAVEELARPFDLARGPLLRMTIVHIDDDRHELLLTMHHIVSDGQSMQVFYNELWTLYRAFVERRPSPLPELPAQYADFVRWQRDLLQGEELERQLAYWREQLADAPPFLALPTDRPRPVVQSFRGRARTFTLTSELSREVDALAKREGVTPFMLLLAAFNAILARYTGQARVVVGTPMANRSRAELEGLIGFFMNTLVLATDMSGAPRFREAVRRVRDIALGAYAHQHLPFEKLVEELQPERSLGHNPLFQVMFTVQNAPPGSEAGEASDAVVPPSLVAKFDMQLWILHGQERLAGALEYNTDLFDDDTAGRFIEHFQNLLTAAVADPDIPIDRLPLIGPEERRQLLVEWNPSLPELEPWSGVHECVGAQARRTPDAPAVVWRGLPLSYRELDERANRLAHHLIVRGVGRETPVALYLDRSFDLMVALLAIQRSGGALVPLDLAYPQQRVAFILDDAEVAVIVTSSARAVELPPYAGAVVTVDGDADAIGRCSADAVELSVTSNQLAYVIYTSGSTGRPKGVAVPHSVLRNLIDWQIGASLVPRGATLQYTSLSFDVAQQEIFATWSAGGRLVLVDEDDRRDPSRLLRVLTDERVERLFLPFVGLQNLAAAMRDGAAIPSSLREVITAGEQLQITQQVARMFTMLPHCRLSNQYGPSETHIVSEYLLADDRRAWPPLPPIGRPVDRARFYVLDEELQPLPIGVPGELYIGGEPVLARGYLRRRELTAERFVPDPFAGEPGARMYRSGDRARFLADGNVEFLGRADRQVKIRGYRVEPAEIETVLSGHSHVREAAVVVRGSGAERRLVAYVVPISAVTHAVTHDELRAYLRSQLPDYMVPSVFATQDALPRTATGKIDRDALPEPDVRRADFASEPVAPRTVVEGQLAAIFAGVLQVDAVGVSDNFFDLGGHSLSAMQLISRLRDAFGVEMPVLRVFELPTVEQLVPALAGSLLEQVTPRVAAELLEAVETTAEGAASSRS